MPDSPGLGEQALNKAAKIGLSSQLDAVENLVEVGKLTLQSEAYVEQIPGA